MMWVVDNIRGVSGGVVEEARGLRNNTGQAGEFPQGFKLTAKSINR